jgi:hypothetical protein
MSLIVRFTTRAARHGISPIVGRQPARLRRIIPAAGDITLGCAVDAYLATLRGAEQASTRRVYGRILRRLAAKFGSETPPNEIGVERFAVWFGQQWAERSPSTWNVSLDAVRSAVAYWQQTVHHVLRPQRPASPGQDRRPGPLNGPSPVCGGTTRQCL